MPHRNSTVISNLSMTNFSSFILLHPLSPSPRWITLKQFLWSQSLPASQIFLLRFRVCVCVCVCVWSHLAAWGIFVSWLGMEPTSLALRPQSPNYWTSREVSFWETAFAPFFLGTKSAVLISTSFFFFFFFAISFLKIVYS